MIILDTTTRKLQLLLSGVVTTTELPWTAHYVDVTIATGALSDVLCANGTTNGVTAVDMVAAPASGVRREIKELTVCNEDTVAATVTIRYNDNGTTRRICKVTLAADDNLEYGD